VRDVGGGGAPGGQACGSSCDVERVARSGLSRGRTLGAVGAENAGDHIRKRCIACDGSENLPAGSGAGPGASADVDRDGVDKLSIDFGFEATQAEVSGLMIPASSGTAGPMNGEGFRGGAEFLVESAGEFQGAGLGFDQREVAVVMSAS